MCQYVYVKTFVKIYVFTCVCEFLSIRKYMYTYVLVNREVDDNFSKEMHVYVCVCQYVSTCNC